MFWLHEKNTSEMSQLEIASEIPSDPLGARSVGFMLDPCRQIWCLYSETSGMNATMTSQHSYKIKL